MARAAKARGFDYLTITDHSASASYAGGLDAGRLAAQRAAIAEAQREVGAAITILAGTESDILADGSLDFSLEQLGALDVAIASVHQRFGQNEDAMTERLVRCMRAPIKKIWGHPLGRLLMQRRPIEVRLEDVLAAARETDTVIEVNGDPHRLDMPPEHLRRARACGLRFVLSADAHSDRGLDAVAFAVMMARRAGIRRSEVLNTLDARLRGRPPPPPLRACDPLGTERAVIALRSSDARTPRRGGRRERCAAGGPVRRSRGRGGAGGRVAGTPA